MCLLFILFLNTNKNNTKNNNKIEKKTDKKRTINIDDEMESVEPLKDISKVDFKKMNIKCYQLCLRNQLNDLFDSLPSKASLLYCKKRSYMVCNIYKITQKELPLDIGLSENTSIILKVYLSNIDNYWNYIHYKTLNEVFFQTVAYHNTNIRTPEIYFWGYNFKLLISYIAMYYINSNDYTTINNIVSTPRINHLSDEYYNYVLKEFKQQQFFHNDLVNNGNIITDKKKPFNDLNSSYIIDFGEADISNNKPFEIKSPSSLLKQNG